MIRHRNKNYVISDLALELGNLENKAAQFENENENLNSLLTLEYEDNKLHHKLRREQDTEIARLKEENEGFRKLSQADNDTAYRFKDVADKAEAKASKLNAEKRKLLSLFKPRMTNGDYTRVMTIYNSYLKYQAKKLKAKAVK